MPPVASRFFELGLRPTSTRSSPSSQTTRPSSTRAVALGSTSAP